MTLEIELKYRVSDHGFLEEPLARLGFHRTVTVTEEDQYLNAPDRDFARTGEAFRLRREGENLILSYKGPKLPGVAKTRRELEVPVARSQGDSERLLELLGVLGFRPVGKVVKRRSFLKGSWLGAEVTVCLDSVESIGSFVELEQVVDPSQAEPVSRRLGDLAKNLGLVDLEPRSYLSLVLGRDRGTVTC